HSLGHLFKLGLRPLHSSHPADRSLGDDPGGGPRLHHRSGRGAALGRPQGCALADHLLAGRLRDRVPAGHSAADPALLPLLRAARIRHHPPGLHDRRAGVGPAVFGLYLGGLSCGYRGRSARPTRGCPGSQSDGPSYLHAHRSAPGHPADHPSDGELPGLDHEGRPDPLGRHRPRDAERGADHRGPHLELPYPADHAWWSLAHHDPDRGGGCSLPRPPSAQDWNSAEMTQPIIKFDKVVKAFGSFVVLNQLDFEVQPGEKVTIIGPSGSGKSTVLRILMTLEPITGGVVYVDGQPLWHEQASDGTLKPASEAHLRKMREKM